ncbi:MAG: YfiR family protein [Candidatus Thiodiazotropha sp. (ex Lucina aurantia)]|nr:YfiR family protein [Candidatus Thiodiazotropha sp. (ex Lucina pensylvanica)]MBT3022849.1 YfiR family protein [Candidatus Thiodiazotropha taylori]MBV2101185.1 YfiR family protein [Candidatus Thiodiazotropha sp. (ex Codakia orbicularis)]MBV2102821.1 YfiR family protein [Candidatus Thiodiazotropha sp. (ex Lucina aurantia)]MBV2117391.1 YfiR family protein [Candidatus Thiodiazotropha sp. (ex Lucina aurantia)]
MTTRLLTLITLLALGCINFAAFAEQQQGEENLLKAAFIFNFAKFARWPDGKWSEDKPSLKICSIGYDELANTLSRLNGKTLREHPVQIMQKQETDQLDVCHVLYLANSLKYEAIEITDLLQVKPILTVSEIPGFAESGGMIELYQRDGRIRFKVNLDITREAGLDLSSRLLKLAIVVGGP